MISLLLTFCASFVFIFLKAFQQRNVAFDQYVWIIPTSLLMAAVEFYVIINAVQQGYSFWMILAIGFGSGAGALLAAITHKRMFSK